MAKAKKSETSYERLLDQERLIVRVTERIAERMQQAGVRKADLAQRLGTSKAYVTQALSGGQNLTLRSLADIADALECEIDVDLRPAALDVSYAKRSEPANVAWSEVVATTYLDLRSYVRSIREGPVDVGPFAKMRAAASRHDERRRQREAPADPARPIVA